MNEFATHCAYSSVPAGVAVTLLHLQLTVDPRETRQASTRIAALSCVHTGGAIHTGTVMGAEVQIWGERRGFVYRQPSTPDVYQSYEWNTSEET